MLATIITSAVFAAQVPKNVAGQLQKNVKLLESLPAVYNLWLYRQPPHRRATDVMLSFEQQPPAVQLGAQTAYARLCFQATKDSPSGPYAEEYDYRKLDLFRLWSGRKPILSTGYEGYLGILTVKSHAFVVLGRPARGGFHSGVFPTPSGVPAIRGGIIYDALAGDFVLSQRRGPRKP